MLDKMKQLYEFQRKARAIQKELANSIIDASREDGKIRVVFNGEQKLQSISISEEFLRPERKTELEGHLKSCIGEAITRSQQVAAGKMKDIAGQMGISGLPGM